MSFLSCEEMLAAARSQNISLSEAMLQSPLINLLCDRADDKYGGRLPVHVRLILDEFANIGQIPNFDKLIATIRSREISASIILQSQSQPVSYTHLNVVRALKIPQMAQ